MPSPTPRVARVNDTDRGRAGLAARSLRQKAPNTPNIRSRVPIKQVTLAALGQRLAVGRGGCPDA